MPALICSFLIGAGLIIQVIMRASWTPQAGNLKSKWIRDSHACSIRTQNELQMQLVSFTFCIYIGVFWDTVINSSCSILRDELSSSCSDQGLQCQGLWASPKTKIGKRCSPSFNLIARCLWCANDYLIWFLRHLLNKSKPNITVRLMLRVHLSLKKTSLSKSFSF